MDDAMASATGRLSARLHGLEDFSRLKVAWYCLFAGPSLTLGKQALQLSACIR